MTPEQRQLNLESFDHVWTTIRDRHWDPELGGLDWASVRDELRPRIEQAAVMSEARAIMRDMISRLGQSHFAIISARAYEDLDLPAGEGSRDGHTGIHVRVIDGMALITSVDEDSPAARAGVRPGWVIVNIGDEDIPSKLQTLSREFEGRTIKDLSLAYAVEARLRGPVGDTVEIRFCQGEDRPVDLPITLAKAKGRKVHLGHLPAFYVWSESERLDGNIGYIAFSSFFDPTNVMRTFNDAMNSFMDADGIVIDIRGNPGGIGPMAMGMAGWLVGDQGQRLGTMYMRDAELKFTVTPRPNTFAGPVAILVDGLCGSTAEIFAGGLKDLGRAPIVGSRTAGAALPSNIERLPNGDGFQYAVANYVSEGGEVLEGVGVIPDIEVFPTREALLAGRDPVLEAAVAWIRENR